MGFPERICEDLSGPEGWTEVEEEAHTILTRWIFRKIWYPMWWPDGITPTPPPPHLHHKLPRDKQILSVTTAYDGSSGSGSSCDRSVIGSRCTLRRTICKIHSNLWKFVEVRGQVAFSCQEVLISISTSSENKLITAGCPAVSVINQKAVFFP